MELFCASKLILVCLKMFPFVKFCPEYCFQWKKKYIYQIYKNFFFIFYGLSFNDFCYIVWNTIEIIWMIHKRIQLFLWGIYNFFFISSFFHCICIYICMKTRNVSSNFHVPLKVENGMYSVLGGGNFVFYKNFKHDCVKYFARKRFWRRQSNCPLYSLFVSFRGIVQVLDSNFVVKWRIPDENRISQWSRGWI